MRDFEYEWYNWPINSTRGSWMKLSREEVLHIARLARLGLTEEDVDKFREQLSNILENFEILRQVDTTDVPPTTQSLALQLYQQAPRSRLREVYVGVVVQ